MPVLGDIRKFFRDKTTSNSLASVKGMVKTIIGAYGEPLADINLDGASKDVLTGGALTKGGALSYLNTAKGAAETFKLDYIALNSYGDGNCGLNSLAILLTGKQDQQTQCETATKLRTAMCLEIMNNEDI